MKVKIIRNPVNIDAIDIYLFDKRPDGKFLLGMPVLMEFRVLTDEEMNSIKEPTIRLSGALGSSFLKAFAEALDEEGVKTDKDAKIEGTLEATRYHLEDLRLLLKLNEKKKNG